MTYAWLWVGFAVMSEIAAALFLRYRFVLMLIGFHISCTFMDFVGLSSMFLGCS